MTIFFVAGLPLVDRWGHGTSGFLSPPWVLALVGDAAMAVRTLSFALVAVCVCVSAGGVFCKNKLMVGMNERCCGALFQRFVSFPSFSSLHSPLVCEHLPG
jgi:hypothetical protein